MDKIIKFSQMLQYIKYCYRKDAKHIGELAESGEDKAAVETYENIWMALGDNIKDILEEFHIQCLVIGVQISRSFDLTKKGVLLNEK